MLASSLKGKTESIPMNEQACVILSGVTRTSSPYVFPGRFADTPRGKITPLLKRVREKAGLPKSFRMLHSLRHSFASWLASPGQVSMYELQKLLTHSSPQMTQRYAHLHDDALRKASGVAASLFSAVHEAAQGAPETTMPASSQAPPNTVQVKIRPDKARNAINNATGNTASKGQA